MWGELGFLSGALIFALLSRFSAELKVNKAKFEISYYAFAYMLVSVVFLLWFTTFIFDNVEFLKISILLGDALLMLATVLLICSFTGTKKYIYGGIGFVAGLVFLVVRTALVKPDPYTEGGVLVFNTQTSIAMVLALIFTSIWFVANYQLGKNAISASVNYKNFWNLWYVSSLTATVGFCGFIIAKKPPTIILSFLIICVSYATLAATLYVINKKVIK